MAVIPCDKLRIAESALERGSKRFIVYVFVLYEGESRWRTAVGAVAAPMACVPALSGQFPFQSDRQQRMGTPL